MRIISELLSCSTPRAPRRPNWAPAESPPHDSPIETELARVLIKYINDDSGFYKQVQIETTHGAFRLDFVVESRSGLYGFEADGRDFHDSRRDAFRDAIILDHSDILAIFRISGRAITFFLEEALYAISRIEPSVFSARGLANLRRLASFRMLPDSVFVGSDFVHLHPAGPGQSILMLNYLSKMSGHTTWKRLAHFSRKYPYMTAEEIMRLADREQLKGIK